MRTKLILLTLFAITIPLIVNTANTEDIDFNRVELDSQVQDLLWCGSSNEIIMVLTSKGTVYRSRDRGLSWKRMQNALNLSGQKVADEDQEIGKVAQLMQSPNDDSMVVFIGSHGINWITEDCGASIRALNSGKKIHEFAFHPTEKYWALAATWTDCTKFGDDPCKIYKQLFATQDMGATWTFLKEYVYDFAWGFTKSMVESNPSHTPKERVFITHDPTASGHQNQDKKTWSPSVNLYYSDDFFKGQKKLALSNGNSIIMTDHYMFVAKANKKEWVEIFVSTSNKGFLDFERAKLPEDALQSKSFTVMDTSEQTVFLHIQNHGPETPLGDIFISDGFGKNFSLSLENVIRGSDLVDFEKVNSLEGVFIANRFDTEHSHNDMYAKNGKKDSISESAVIQDRLDRMRRNQDPSNMNINQKQQRTKNAILKESDEFDKKELEKNMRTFITHNKGGKWELIKAPTEDSDGKKIDCYIEEGCSLNLEIYSSNGRFAPPYSQDSSVGIIMAIGNIGYQLETRLNDRVNTYISRDGGLNWQEVKKGSYIYEIGDHGGLIVMARHDSPTKEVIYSFNEGKSWHVLEVSSEPFDITNIIIEPLSVSQEFVIYGTSPSTSGEQSSKGIVVTIDFKGLHEPQCKGADRPGDTDSDYELWTPFDGRHGDQKCVMGQQITYIRRKQDAECFNGEELERKILRSYCPCNEMDYECDYGYSRGTGQTCVKESWMQDIAKQDQLTNSQQDQCNNFGFYTVSQGYRRVPGNKCAGGLDLNPTVYSCSPYSLFSMRTVLFLIIAFAAIYFGWPLIEGILIALPIPDPKELKEKILSIFRGRGAITQRDQQNKKDQYTKNFNQAPECLGESSDEEDLGKSNGNSSKPLSYDTDEDKDGGDGFGGEELINLDGSSNNGSARDRTNTAAEKIPKLQKPL